MHTTLYPVLEDPQNPGATKMMTREELEEQNLTVGSKEAIWKLFVKWFEFFFACYKNISKHLENHQEHNLSVGSKDFSYNNYDKIKLH